MLRAVVMVVMVAVVVGCGTEYGDSQGGSYDYAASRGAALYQEMCQTCHGEIGEGGLGPALLDTPRSVNELRSAIAERMPANNPGQCSGECATEVARFIAEGLTSSALRCDGIPPGPRRLRLLTRREYRATVHDLFGEAAPVMACARATECGFRDRCEAGACRLSACDTQTFVYDPQGRTLAKVHVAGTFNAWAGTIAGGGYALARDATTGLWSGTFAVGEGIHQYKLVLDERKSELSGLRGKLGTVDRTKLDVHLEAVREVEQRIAATGGGGGGGSTCQMPAIDATGINASTLYAPERFPQILRAQIDLMVQAMACNFTRVGVLQSSIHTSELIMSRFTGTPMYDPGFDMRSHQASHYGASHDPNHREYLAFAQQCTWWTEQFAYLLGQLAARPEDGGTMLDHSLVLLCTEVCDGNTHGHDDMPFVLAGGGNGRVRTGRLLQLGYRRHADLLLSIANAMGDGLSSFGDASSGGVPGLLA